MLTSFGAYGSSVILVGEDQIKTVSATLRYPG